MALLWARLACCLTVAAGHQILRSGKRTVSVVVPETVPLR